MNNTNSEYQELISALVDGQIDDKDYARLLVWMTDNPNALNDWHDYHLVGEVLRSGERASIGFKNEKQLSVIRTRLKSELPQVGPIQVIRPNSFELKSRQSANQSRFFWRLTAGLASLTAAVVFGWQLFSSLNFNLSGNQLATNDSSSLQQEVQIMIRNPELDKLLEDHRHNGGISAFQLPAGFVRNSTFDKTSR